MIQAFDGTVYYPLVLVAAITVPMQGLPNFLVYLRPKIRRARRLNPNAHWCKWFVRSVAMDDSNLLSMSRHHTARDALTTGDRVIVHEDTMDDREEDSEHE